MDWRQGFWPIDQYIARVALGPNDFVVRIQAHVLIERYGDIDRGLRAPLINPHQDAHFLLGSLSLRQVIVVEGNREIVPIDRPIGNFGAAFYPENRTWYIQHCHLEFQVPPTDPSRDTNLHQTWAGFEALLRQLFPTERLLTPSHRYAYDDSDWQRFLTNLGYQRLTRETFGKAVT